MRAPLLSSAFLSSANSGPSGWAARRWHGALLRVEAGTLCSLPGTRAYRRKFGVSRERNRPNVDGNARLAAVLRTDASEAQGAYEDMNRDRAFFDDPARAIERWRVELEENRKK